MSQLMLLLLLLPLLLLLLLFRDWRCDKVTECALRVSCTPLTSLRMRSSGITILLLDLMPRATTRSCGKDGGLKPRGRVDMIGFCVVADPPPPPRVTRQKKHNGRIDLKTNV